MQLIEREDNEHGSVMHSVLRLDDSIIEVSDARYETAIAAGATSIMPPTEMPYGERSCGFADPWGVQWWLASYTGSSEQA